MANMAYKSGHPAVALGILALKAGKMVGLYGRHYRCTKCQHFYMP